MINILGSISRGLGGLAQFSGRDAPREFWPYAIFVIGLASASMFAVMAVMMSTTFNRIQEFAVTHPDRVTTSSSPGGYSIHISGNHPELIPNIELLVIAAGVSIFAAALLLAAAVTRRLHDTGRRGYWGLAPLPFAAIGLLAFPRLASSIGQPSANPEIPNLFFVLFINNLLYLGALALLAVLLEKKGRPDANRFGPPSP